MIDYFVYVTVILFGTMIGSFLNVCIYRIPKEEDIVVEPSHCMNCKTRLKWYELVPIFSYLVIRGRCRTCKIKLSVQYPIVEALNGIMYGLVFCIFGWDSVYTLLLSIIYCLTISALIVLSVIDLKTQLIPLGIIIFILVMGLATVIIKFVESGRSMDVLLTHGLGFFLVSLFLLLLFYATNGGAIGGGDVQLMAVAGLLLGWKLIILAFLIGCILAAIIHPIKMRIQDVSRVLAFGPYLSLGIAIAILFGKQIIGWYIDTFFI